MHWLLIIALFVSLLSRFWAADSIESLSNSDSSSLSSASSSDDLDADFHLLPPDLSEDEKLQEPQDYEGNFIVCPNADLGPLARRGIHVIESIVTNSLIPTNGGSRAGYEAFHKVLKSEPTMVPVRPSSLDRTFDIALLILEYSSFQTLIVLQLVSGYFRYLVKSLVKLKLQNSASSLMNYPETRFFWPKILIFASEFAELFSRLYPAYVSRDLGFGEVADLCRMGIMICGNFVNGKDRNLNRKAHLLRIFGGSDLYFYELLFKKCTSVYSLEVLINLPSKIRNNSALQAPSRKKIHRNSAYFVDDRALPLFFQHHPNLNRASLDYTLILGRLIRSGRFSDFIFNLPEFQNQFLINHHNYFLIASAVLARNLSIFRMLLQQPWPNPHALIVLLRRLYIDEAWEASFPDEIDAIFELAHCIRLDLNLLVVLSTFPPAIDVFDEILRKWTHGVSQKFLLNLIFYGHFHHLTVYFNHSSRVSVPVLDQTPRKVVKYLYKQFTEEQRNQIVSSLTRLPAFSLRYLLRMKVLLYEWKLQGRFNELSPQVPLITLSSCEFVQIMSDLSISSRKTWIPRDQTIILNILEFHLLCHQVHGRRFLEFLRTACPGSEQLSSAIVAQISLNSDNQAFAALDSLANFVNSYYESGAIV